MHQLKNKNIAKYANFVALGSREMEFRSFDGRDDNKHIGIDVVKIS